MENIDGCKNSDTEKYKYELQLESLKKWVEIQKCKFESTSYEFKSMSSNSRVASSNLRVTSSNI